MPVKKIILCGPPEAGKTTLKQVFFENANPLQFLSIPLEPTKGFETTVYSMLSEELAVFDLGGQEIERWLILDQSVFQAADFIILVIPVTTILKDIEIFIGRISYVVKNQCPDVKMFLLYHKRDLLPAVKVTQRWKQLQQFLDTKFPDLSHSLTIYVTSITEEFFFQSLSVFTQILTKILPTISLTVTPESFEIAETSLRILLNLDVNTKCHVEYLKSQFSLKQEQADQIFQHLVSLKFLQPLSIGEHSPNQEKMLSPQSPINSGKVFQLSERAQMLIKSIKRQLLHPEDISPAISASQKIFSALSSLSIKNKGIF